MNFNKGEMTMALFDKSDDNLEKYAPKVVPQTPYARNSGEVRAQAKPYDGSLMAELEAQLTTRHVTTFPEGAAGADEPDDEPDCSPLTVTAQDVYDLRFHDLMEMCSKAIAKNPEKLKIEPFDLATGISGWAIDQLKEKPLE